MTSFVVGSFFQRVSNQNLFFQGQTLHHRLPGCWLLALLEAYHRARMFCRPSSEIAYVWLIRLNWSACEPRCQRVKFEHGVAACVVEHFRVEFESLPPDWSAPYEKASSGAAVA